MHVNWSGAETALESVVFSVTLKGQGLWLTDIPTSLNRLVAERKNLPNASNAVPFIKSNGTKLTLANDGDTHQYIAHLWLDYAEKAN